MPASTFDATRGRSPRSRSPAATCRRKTSSIRIGSWENARRQFEFYFYQRLSRFSFLDFDPILRNVLPSILATQAPALLHSVLRGQKDLPPCPESPDLMFLN
jgi:hypothetical protein